MTASIATASTRFILLNTPARTRSSVRLCGNHDSLGWWDLNRGVALHGRGSKSWSGQLELHLGQSYEFKFAHMEIMSDGSWSPVWENGENRLLEVPLKPCAVDVICHWGNTAEMEVLVEELRYGSEIAEMLSQQHPMEGGVVMAGSSIFRLWGSAALDLAPFPIINRAFGGSVTHEQLTHMDEQSTLHDMPSSVDGGQIILPLKPRILMYYCGSNDINAGVTPKRIAANFLEFSRRLHLSCPETFIIYVSIIKSPEKTGKFHLVEAANDLVRRHCSANSTKHVFLDLNPILFNNDGITPRYELYENDMLHFLPEAYRKVLGPAILPVLASLWDGPHSREAPSQQSRM